jgi:hypothetical protein
MQSSGLTSVRHANPPPMKQSGTQNQVTAMLWDLTFYEPAKVTVFGADFYTGNFEDWYDPATTYRQRSMTDPRMMTTVTRAALWHDQTDNRRIVKAGPRPRLARRRRTLPPSPRHDLRRIQRHPRSATDPSPPGHSRLD